MLSVCLGLLLAGPPGLDLAQLASIRSGRVGASLLLVETGESGGFHDGESFPMQSVYKIPIAMAVLDRVDRHALSLTTEVPVHPRDMPGGIHSPLRDAHPDGVTLTVRELIRAAIVDSDGTASDVLMALAGGPAAITGYLRALGLEGIHVRTTEAAMARDGRAQYRNDCSPRAAVRLLTMLQQGHGISPDARAIILDDMTATTTFPGRIRGSSPPAPRWRTRPAPTVLATASPRPPTTSA